MKVVRVPIDLGNTELPPMARFLMWTLDPRAVYITDEEIQICVLWLESGMPTDWPGLIQAIRVSAARKGQVEQAMNADLPDLRLSPRDLNAFTIHNGRPLLKETWRGYHRDRTPDLTVDLPRFRWERNDSRHRHWR